ncbi:MAG TPA: ABC transporter permease [Bryobacteraceae bacterium]|jgi:putative ABC transport system permease protein|nr:ABC transporter permease [Bryobacteraceae bacterium]
MLSDFARNLRFSFRQLSKRPAFSLTAILVLALGLGANTAIFSIINAFLLRPLPYPQPDRLMALFERDPVGPPGSDPYNMVAPGNFLDWQKLSKTFTSIAAASSDAVNLASPQNLFEPQRAPVCFCSQSMFETLGVQPVLGRAFRPEEDRTGAPRVAIISYGLWQRQFGGDRNIIHRQVRINGTNHEIVGVMPRGFGFPYRDTELWMPLLQNITPEQAVLHDSHFLFVVGRLRPDVTVAAAKAEIDGFASRYKRDHPLEVSGKGGNVVPLQQYLVQDVRTSLLVLLGAVGCVLIIACVNVANLLLSRAAARTREIGIREAIGASRGQIIQQLLTESIVLAVAGAACGLLLASFIANMLISHAPNAGAVLPPGSVPFSPMVFLFAFGVALLAGAAAGLYPALQSARSDLANSLKDSTRSSTASRSHGRFRNILVAAEVALSLVLLAGAGLLGRSFMRLYRVNPGVRIANTATVGLSIPDPLHTDRAKTAEIIRNVVERVGQTPGVRAAGATSCPPVLGHCNDWVFRIEGRPLPPGQMLDALTRYVDPGFFSAAGVPLLRGRDFTPQDGIGFDPQKPRLCPVLVSDSFARQFFPGEDPIGHFITRGIDYEFAILQHIPVPRYQIVGVVGDVLEQIDAKIQPTMYYPLYDGRANDIWIVLHTATDPHSVMGSVREAIHQVRPDLPVFDMRTMDEALGRSASDRRFNMLLLVSFAALALLLAAVGLYGVLSYGVTQRTSEIGIRLALGADAGNVRMLVLKQGMLPALIGVGVGLLVAASVTRVLSSLLFHLDPGDPLTFAVVTLLLLAVSALACYLPALRATRIDPTVALRTE